MEIKRYNIILPPIRDDVSGYTYLGRIANAILSEPQHRYVFDFSKCSTISHNGLAVIGGICNYLKRYEESSSKLSGLGLSNWLAPDKVGFKIDGISPPLMNKLRLIGFWNYVKPNYGVIGSKDYIGYREHETVLEDSEIVNHLRNSWLTGEKLSMSEPLKAEIVSSIYEIFVNAYGHGLKDNLYRQSVISCGYYDSKSKELSLSVLDFGGGIVKSVQKHTGMADRQRAFEWALEVGNSTRTDSSSDLPRGLGFGILKEFVQLNGGVLRVCSDSYMATIDQGSDYTTNELPGFFAGTLVSITVKCDNNHYKLKAETVDELPTYF